MENIEYRIVKEKSKWNFINIKGEYLSDQWFDAVWEFVEGFAKVGLNGKFNFINTACEYLSDQWFDYVDNFLEGIVRVQLNKKWNLLNTKGEIVSEQWFDSVDNFENGFARVALKGKWNFLKLDGTLLSNLWFDVVWGFVDGFIKVYLNGKGWNFINTEGKLISDQWFDDVSYFYNGFAPVLLKDKGWSFLNTKGQLLNNINNISTDEDLLMCTSYRYCIGKQTYVTTLAYYIASHYYSLLTDNRKQFISKDIKLCINQILSYNHPSLVYAGNVNYDNRDGLNDLIVFLNKNIDTEQDLIGIEDIEVSQVSYSDCNKIYNITRTDKINTILNLDLTDLLVWYTLAQSFNIKDYKVILCKTDDGEKEICCFETWKPQYQMDDNGNWEKLPFKYVKTYVPVDDYISNPYNVSCLNPNNILTIKSK